MEITENASITITGTSSEIAEVIRLINNQPVETSTQENERNFLKITNILFKAGVHLKITNKIALIKEVRAITGWELAQSKDWVDNHTV